MSVIEVLSTPEELASAVATRLLAVLAAAQAEGREPQVALTGGTIADVVHRAVARLCAAAEAADAPTPVDWSRVGIWWGDERFVAPDSPDRNALQARSALLDHLPLDPGKVHEMASTADVSDVDAGAAAYADLLRAHGGGEFDLVMLGVGPDGHVASLFPGHASLLVDDAIALGVTDSPKPPPERITLTLPALNRSRAVWFLASGEAKAPAVAHALREESQIGREESQIGREGSLPAARVRGRIETVWFVDAAAAAGL